MFLNTIVHFLHRQKCSKVKFFFLYTCFKLCGPTPAVFFWTLLLQKKLSYSTLGTKLEVRQLTVKNVHR